MDSNKRLTRIFMDSPEVLFDSGDKIVIMSDCHRGDASWADNFAKNQNIYFHALDYYYDENYTYIELGDGDELWENKDMEEIKGFHSNVFHLLAEFYKRGRLYMIYGNHDMVKRKPAFANRFFKCFYDEFDSCELPLFPGITFHEGLVLKHRDLYKRIFLLHGHQGDLLNDRLWKLGRFLVRYFWKPLELFGVNDPTRAAENYDKKLRVDSKLMRWAGENEQMVIAGHTHKPVFPKPGETMYFNDGSCVHPRCITAIEITEGKLMLVKWAVNTKPDGSLFIDREILAGPERLDEYYSGARELMIKSGGENGFCPDKISRRIDL